MNKTTIDWPDLTHTINPVSGCLRNCNKESHGFDCYANKLHTMRHRAVGAGKKLPFRYRFPFNKMVFYPLTLSSVPKRSRVIKKVFVGSMSDICYWKPEWLVETLEFCEERPEMEFMFLTKDPGVYKKYYFPKNCWQGFTVIDQSDIDIISIKNPGYLSFIRGRSGEKNRKFLSIEPLINNVVLGNLEENLIDLVIVGADSSKNPVIPKKEWIDSIKHPNIHYKKNIKKYL